MTTLIVWLMLVNGTTLQYHGVTDCYRVADAVIVEADTRRMTPTWLVKEVRVWEQER